MIARISASFRRWLYRKMLMHLYKEVPRLREECGRDYIGYLLDDFDTHYASR